MAMVETIIDIDEQALAAAAEILGTTTSSDTVNAALREIGQRAVARFGEMTGKG
ncbi:type II toxin-antitoxin system VapB family antitoxin [Nocardia macrotermitis]|uniref:DUF2191 domain-containing protein n=1 Tax=Nocardia macrotermitis TaxID=2585198 RepID=A0A7K0DF79_9NOCA|nr:hypothetical protein [Nocardia macrotermitis]